MRVASPRCLLPSSKLPPCRLELELVATKSIFQTFAGLFLDKTKPKAARADQDPSGKSAIHQLLGLLLFLNVCQAFGIIFLWRLDRRRKAQVKEFIQRSHGRPVIAREEEEFDIVPESPKCGRRRLSFAKEQLPESHSLQQRPLSFSSPSLAAAIEENAESSLSYAPPEQDEEERPLLSGEPEGAGCKAQHPEASAPVIGEAMTKGELLRGEIFGALSVLLICFAWIFFIGTAFFKMRSKEDREGA